MYNVAVKYVKKTCKYLFSHLPRLLALSIVPAAIVAFFMQPAGFGLFTDFMPLQDNSKNHIVTVQNNAYPPSAGIHLPGVLLPDYAAVLTLH